jgi:glycosyltransferase involved in cell wall biosynthesis
MKILMLGWEFPPFFAGGVGIVCQELAKELSKYPNIQVNYVMPYFKEKEFQYLNNFKVLNASIEKIKNLKIFKVNSAIKVYDSEISYLERIKKYEEELELQGKLKSVKEIYGKDILNEVYLYSQRLIEVSKKIDFDIIHAHDWTTVPAAIVLKKLTGNPFIFHVHITEFDKTGDNGGWEEIIKIEKEGLKYADKIISVSNFTKKKLVEKYGADPNKIEVIHNGGVSDLKLEKKKNNFFKDNSKIVLFAGRITLQKGPEYFLKAAKKVLEVEKDVKFVMAGSGDMLSRMIELSAELGISKNVLFFGQYSRQDADKLFSMADVFVMPSVSEPFGIVPLEAISKGVPTIISKQSGISEVLSNVFKVDYWDIEKMADRIVAILRYDSLSNHMKELSSFEFENLTWEKPVRKIINLYLNILKNKNLSVKNNNF